MPERMDPKIRNRPVDDDAIGFPEDYESFDVEFAPTPEQAQKLREFREALALALDQKALERLDALLAGSEPVPERERLITDLITDALAQNGVTGADKAQAIERFTQNATLRDVARQRLLDVTEHRLQGAQGQEDVSRLEKLLEALEK